MGADAVDIGKTIHPHPTLGESIGMAAEVAHGSCTDVPPACEASRTCWYTCANGATEAISAWKLGWLMASRSVSSMARMFSVAGTRWLKLISSEHQLSSSTMSRVVSL
jgi:hypothetical protein